MSNPALPLVPGRRAGLAEIEAQARLLEAVPVVAQILDTVPALAMVLNSTRQIVLANRAAARLAGTGDAAELRGRRPGEVLDCVHARETPEGCGEAEACSVCGALAVIRTAAGGRANTQECRIVRRGAEGDELVEVEFSAAPLTVGGQQFSVIAGADTSDRARRRWLEQAVIPQAAALAGEMAALAAAVPEGAGALLAASRRLTALLRETAELAGAEAGGYACASVNIPVGELLAAAAGEASRLEAATGRNLLAEPAPAWLTVETDPVLARRVLEKLLVNALEATPAGGTVRFGCHAAGQDAELWIHNAGEIPRPAQYQVFQRLFSTKGAGRGSGTYFVKLMTERCLGGTASFESTPEKGTTFFVRLRAAHAEVTSRAHGGM
jgi:hypothetical protein